MSSLSSATLNPNQQRSRMVQPEKSNLRVLLVAEACNPEMISVPLEGWSHSTAIADLPQVDGLIVTQVRNREAILATGRQEPADFVAIDTEKVAVPAWKLANAVRGGANKGWTTVAAIRSITYPYFESKIWKQFGGQIRGGEFDVVHRLTPLSPTTSSLLARKCRQANVPFILGPLNGGVPWPREFDSARRREREWLSYVRDGYKLLPGFKQTRKNSSAIIIGSQDTWKQMPARYHEKCIYIPENGIDPARFTHRRQRHTEGPLRIVFVGRLVPYKGAHLLIESAAQLMRDGKATLTIVGDGPEMARLKEIAEREQVQSQVEFVGRVPHQQVQQHLIESDLFAFPSIREFGGAVALEAMAVGLVPLVVRYGGLAELVTEETGFFAEIGSRDAIVDSFRDTLERVVADRELIESRTKPAIRRASEQFSWQAKAQQVREVYRWVVGQRTEKPDWGMPLAQL
ncbi:glycosyltransferase [Stieleria sp. TO1_6]|uniref:glycosyltransferase family 4 protein n=1 Tax=Stieleria tagensis TaxID=2956795 RepID=UPI00209ACD60|nr:glycosyltransferase [Stieleria tagensis]MCO8120669.1 glycosyltransferase [Stieleria tagensis]